jgi:hypothetical protein
MQQHGFKHWPNINVQYFNNTGHFRGKVMGHWKHSILRKISGTCTDASLVYLNYQNIQSCIKEAIYLFWVYFELYNMPSHSVLFQY